MIRVLLGLVAYLGFRLIGVRLRLVMVLDAPLKRERLMHKILVKMAAKGVARKSKPELRVWRRDVAREGRCPTVAREELLFDGELAVRVVYR